jgi:hypothetical protein
MQIPEDSIRYIDLPDVSETFADSIGFLTFDGQIARIDFCVTRVDPPKPPEKLTARRYPVCRLALQPDAFLALYNQMQQIITDLQQQGVIKQMPPIKKEPVQ